MQKDELDLNQFPTDKNAPIIVYCNGPRCWKSYKASVLLIKAGYKKSTGIVMVALLGGNQGVILSSNLQQGV